MGESLYAIHFNESNYPVIHTQNGDFAVFDVDVLDNNEAECSGAFWDGQWPEKEGTVWIETFVNIIDRQEEIQANPHLLFEDYEVIDWDLA